MDGGLAPLGRDAEVEEQDVLHRVHLALELRAAAPLEHVGRVLAAEQLGPVLPHDGVEQRRRRDRDAAVGELALDAQGRREVGEARVELELVVARVDDSDVTGGEELVVLVHPDERPHPQLPTDQVRRPPEGGLEQDVGVEVPPRRAVRRRRRRRGRGDRLGGRGRRRGCREGRRGRRVHDVADLVRTRRLLRRQETRLLEDALDRAEPHLVLLEPRVVGVDLLPHRLERRVDLGLHLGGDDLVHQLRDLLLGVGVLVRDGLEELE